MSLPQEAPGLRDPLAPHTLNARQLMAIDLPPTKWVIPGLVPQGLMLLAGKPKLGKSFLTANLALAVATGGKALGSIEVVKGPVLALMLEDNQRRLQTRVRLLLGEGEEAPDDLEFRLAWPRLDAGGLERLEEEIRWVEPRLVIIDTLQKVRHTPNRNSGLYADDYKALDGLKALADRYDLAVLCVHHTRKTSSDDALEEISGSTGLTGAADTLAVLRRSRGKADAEMFVTGRDIEDVELALEFENGLWTSLGSAAEARRSGERQRVLAVLQEHGPMTPAQVAKALGEKNSNRVRKLLSGMLTDGEVVKGENQAYSYNPQ